MSKLNVQDLGQAAYAPTLELQMQLVERMKNSEDQPSTLLLVEHDPPVITLGRRGKEEDFKLPKETIVHRGIEIHEISRGGEVTCHAPGQLVGYPITHLQRVQGRTVRGHVHSLEETIIQVLARFGIQAGREKGFTGVWIGSEKIAAIGVAVHRWVTYHGFALNVCNDLSMFDLFVPCGITDKGVTSVSKLLGRAVAVEEIKPMLIECFAEVFGYDEVTQTRH